VSYSQYDVVLMLFPFTERKGKKQRPAVVLSSLEFNQSHQHSIVAMVTTASVTQWKSDLALKNVAEAGLLIPCVIRAKLFTISHELVIGRVGSLSAGDSVAVERWSASLFGE
jgi:mRNA interferase MazF